MALLELYSDDFNRADGELSAPWATGSYKNVGMYITSNELKAAAPIGDVRTSYYSERTFSRGCWAEVTIAALPPTGENMSPRVLCAEDGTNAGYECTLQSDGIQIYLDASGTGRGFIGPKHTTAAQVGQKVRFETYSDSDDLVIFLDDVEIIRVADATYQSGYLVLNAYEPAGGNIAALDDWRGGVEREVLGIDSVNGNDEIVSNGSINIQCKSGDLVTGATLDGVALTILSQDYSSVTCEAVDLHATTSPPDAVVSLVITDGATSPAQDVTWRSAAGLTHIVAASISTSPPGLLGTTTQTAVVGDIYEGPTTAADGQSALTYISDGPHRNLDPAVPNATVTEGWFYDVSASSWEIITETTNRADGALAPSWKAVPTPPACVVGLAYSYVMTSILDGDRPMTLTLETGALPAGLSINSTNESIEGTPTASGEFSGLTIGAENAA